MKHRKIALSLLAFALALAALLPAARGLLAAPPPPLGPPVFRAQRDALQAQLDTAGEPAARALLADKVAALDGLEAMRAAGAGMAPTKAASSCARRPGPNEERFPTGILNGPETVLPDRDLVVLNAWQGMLDGQRVIVLAAVREEDSSQAVIVVRSLDSAWGAEVPAPDGSGELRLTAERGPLLALENAAGQTFWFDPAALAFASQPAGRSAQVIPAPTYTPAPGPCD